MYKYTRLIFLDIVNIARFIVYIQKACFGRRRRFVEKKKMLDNISDCTKILLL